MKKITALVLTYMISTTLVFAQHTNASIQSDINQIFTQINNVNEYKALNSAVNKTANTCESIDSKQLIKRIDKRIAKASKRNETLEESIKLSTKRYNKVRSRHKKVVKRILKRKRRTNRAYKKAKKSNPELTRVAFVKGLKKSISLEKKRNDISNITNILTEAGSMESYLKMMKTGIETCDQALLGDNAGLIYLIIFIGVPVLGILGALFALIFGLFSLSLWLFLGSLAILLVFFVLGNLGSKVFIPNKEEYN